MSNSDKHIEQLGKKEVEQQVIDKLKTVYDPEIPVDIYELGLIYEVNIDDDYNAEIVMTLTSPSCPVAESLPEEVREKVDSLWCVKTAKVELVWEPPWTKDMMSEEAMLELGFM